MYKKLIKFTLLLIVMLASATAGASTGDTLFEDFNTEQSIENVSTNPADWGITLEWVSPDESGNGTGAMNCVLDYAYATPEFYADLVVGKTYKFCVSVKPSHDFLEDNFNFFISADGLTEGSDSSYKMVTVDNVDWKAGEWVKLEALYTWTGVLGGNDVSSDDVKIKFRVGSGLFEDVTGDKNTKYSFCLDDFSLSPYIPNVKAKVMGEYKTGEKIKLKCSYDFLYKNAYQDFLGFDGATINTLKNGEIIKTEYAKESVFDITDEYLGDEISFEIYPVVYGEEKEKLEIPPQKVEKRENKYNFRFFSKIIEPEMEFIEGKAEFQVYDETKPTSFMAAYSKDKMIDTTHTLKIKNDNAEKISAFVWDNCTPLMDKKSIKREENSIAFYVDSQNGADTNKGTYLSPFKTVERAKKEVEKVIEENNNNSGKLKWHYSDGVLRISGKHEMLDYDEVAAPWSGLGEKVRTLIIDEGVKSIGNNAFYGFFNIKNAVLPQTLESIGENAFTGCTRLFAVVLANSVLEVSANSFEETTSLCVSQSSPLAGIDGFKVYTIGEESSEYLTNQYVSDSNIGWALYEDTLVISGNSNMTGSVTFAELGWSEYSNQITTAVIQPGITYTPLNLFSGHDDEGKSNYPNLKTYTVCDGLKKISTNEIDSLSALEVFDISNTTESIMHYVSGNSLLIPVKKLEIPKTVTSIGSCAFNNLTGLKELTLEEGFNYIHNGDSEWSSVFRNISSLETITFPKSLDKLGAYFIARAPKLNEITVLNPDMEFADNCLYLISEDVTVKGIEGSTAQAYAEKMGYSFEALSETIMISADEDTGYIQGSTDKIYVMLKAGEHFIEDTLEFDYTHSSENIQIEYTSYGDGKAVLTGGKKIEGWEIHDEEKNIYKAYVGKEIQSRQLFVNGVRANRARSEGGFINYSVDENGYLCDNTELLEYEHPEDMEILIHVAWTTPRCGIKTISEEDDRVRVTPDKAAWDILWGRSLNSFQQCRPNNPYYYENAYELLDKEGEWYLNSHDGYLYYKPRAFDNIDTAEIIMPVTEQLIKINGSEYLPVENICFDNIEFAYATWLRPNSEVGHCSNQNNTIWEGEMDKIYYPDGAIDVECATNIDFRNCTFTKLGTIALKMHRGVQECDIEENIFYDLSAAAIVVSDRYGEANTTENDVFVNRDIIIKNNLIHHIGQDFHDSAALTTGYVMNTKISDNEIFDVPYSGFHLGFVNNENYISGLRVTDNYLHDYMNKMTDGGGIYMFSSTAGTKENPNIISGNYVTGGWHGVMSVALDHGVSNVNFSENVLDAYNNKNTLDSYAAEWSNGWVPYDFGYSSQHFNLSFSDNFGTNGYKTDEAAANCTVEGHTLSEFGVWNDKALSIIEKSGTKNLTVDLPREIEIPDMLEIKAGDEINAPYYVYDEKGKSYEGDNLSLYCYSDNPEVIEVVGESVLRANSNGEANITMIFKCGTVLRERTLKITVK